jgi:hypothetical protein
MTMTTKTPKLTPAEKKALLEAESARKRQAEKAKQTRERLVRLQTFRNLDTLPYSTLDDLGFMLRDLLRKMLDAQRYCVQYAEQLRKRCEEVATNVAAGGTGFYTNPMDNGDAASSYAKYITLRELGPDTFYAAGYYTMKIVTMLGVAAEAETSRLFSVRDTGSEGYAIANGDVWGVERYASEDAAWVALDEQWTAARNTRREALVTLWNAAVGTEVA